MEFKVWGERALQALGPAAFVRRMLLLQDCIFLPQTFWPDMLHKFSGLRKITWCTGHILCNTPAEQHPLPP